MTTQIEDAPAFTAKERELIRREMCRHFGQDPRIADGLFLRTWRGGERKGSQRSHPLCRACWTGV